jgi:hypothetical protein
MVFFRCRAQLYSEDAFWEKEDAYEPSPAALNVPYMTDFLPNDKDLQAPWEYYVEHLQNYSLCELTNDTDTVNTFQGILKCIAKNLGTPTLAGMPQSMLDMTLIWYHRPDIAGGAGNAFRARHAPSWSWAAWTGVLVSTWVPEKKQRWIDHHAGKIEYWYTDENGTNLRPVNTGYPATYAPAPVYPPNVRAQFLQLRTNISTNFNITPGSMGYEIHGTMKYNVLGIIYFDNGGAPDPGPNSTVYTLAQRCHAPDGDVNFDYGYGKMTEDEDSRDEVITVKPALSAKNHDLRWVLVLAWETRSTYRRIGVGHIREHGRGWLDWNPQ